MVIGIITARGGSKGIPNKNLAPLGSKRLIDFTFDLADRCENMSRVFLSTDCREIIELARTRYERIEVPFVRPSELATDKTGHVEVVNHLLAHLKTVEGIQPDAFVLLQPTSPFRNVSEVRNAIDLFQQKRLKSLLGVVPVMHHPADYIWRQPEHVEGFREVVERAPGTRRQDLPEVYFISGALFICDYKWYLENQRFYDRKSYLFKMSEETLLDIDTAFELKLARGYLSASGAQAV